MRGSAHDARAGEGSVPLTSRLDKMAGPAPASVVGCRVEATNAEPFREADPMQKATRFVGLEVHKDSIMLSWVAKFERKVYEIVEDSKFPI